MQAGGDDQHSVDISALKCRPTHTQWKDVNSTVENLYDLHVHRAEAGKNSINIMNEGSAAIMSPFPKLTSTRTHKVPDL